MKKILLFITLIALSIVVNAQDDNYTGPAKVAVKAFWDGAAKLEKSIAAGGSSMDVFNLGNLQRKMDATKDNDAAYNSIAMETKYKALAEGIDALKKKNDAAIQGNRDKIMNMQNVDKILRSLFQISTDVGYSALKTIKDVIDDYKKRTTEVLAMDRSGNKNDLEKYLAALKSNLKVAENDLYELDRRCREQVVAENAEVNYYELLYKQAFWDAAQKIYPAETGFAKAYATATKIVDGLGGIKEVDAIASKSKVQRIKDAHVPAAVIKDAALEKMFIDVFNKEYGEEFKGTASKAVLLSDDWNIERNEITGIVTGRVRRGAIVYKGTNGKCYLVYSFFIHQEYVGSSFQGTKSIYVVQNGQEMLCENAK